MHDFVLRQGGLQVEELQHVAQNSPVVWIVELALAVLQVVIAPVVDTLICGEINCCMVYLRGKVLTKHIRSKIIE